MPQNSSFSPIHIIGGGLAGAEAAWQLAQYDIPVILHEMRPVMNTEVHITDKLAELVCSNSFRSDDKDYNAVGLLHEEMRLAGSLIMQAADASKVPAGGALAVDREQFSKSVTDKLNAEPRVEIRREEISELPTSECGTVIIATGPLTSSKLASAIQKITGENALAFFDAIAPIVYKESVDFEVAWFQSRYDKGSGKDYINLPMNEGQYYSFIEELLKAQKTDFMGWEETTPYFEGCLPIEVMAKRGPKTLAFGPMKPIGLTNPHAPHQKPYAVVQLRQDNSLGTLYNIVGFQTKLTYSEQKRVFKMIPGLKQAKFARLGGLHRNTFINGPKLLDHFLRLKARPNIRFAGQITGCEGYIESATLGLLAGKFVAAEQCAVNLSEPPPTTAMGALLNHVTGGGLADCYQPMNINFGLFPPIKNVTNLRGREKKKLLTERALLASAKWLKKSQIVDQKFTL